MEGSASSVVDLRSILRSVTDQGTSDEPYRRRRT